MAGVATTRSVRRNGGTIILDGGAGGTVSVSGKLDAASTVARGGAIVITGRTIVLQGAIIDASGATSGGTINIGGGNQGTGPLFHADSMTVDSTSTLAADATADGNGGAVVLWSDIATTFAGAISARGAGSGNGGDAEVSSHGVLNYLGSADLSAAAGRFGNLLLDPYNVTISTSADASSSGFTATGTGSTINVTTLQNQLATANVQVPTGLSGSENGDITVATAIAWSANTTLTLAAAGSVIVNADIANSGTTSGIVLQSGTGAVTGSGNIANAGSLTISTTGTGTLSGSISGGGSLTKSGSGTITLSGANSYTGATAINAGTIIAGSATAVGSNSTASLTNATAKLDLNGYSLTVGSLSGGAGTVTNSSASVATLTTNGGTTGTASINSIFAGVISGNLNLVKQGTGNLTLTADNTYSGTTTINSGTLQIGNSTAAGKPGSGQIVNNGSLSFVRTTNFTIANDISGTGSVTKTSTGTLTLSGNNSYSGTTTITQGQLGAGSSTAFSSNSALTVGTSATLDLAGFSITLGALSSANATGLVTNSGAAATLTIGGTAGNGTYSAVIQDGAGAVSLTKVGSNTETLSGTNTYTGTTTISGGTLNAGSAAGLGNGGAIQFSGGTLQYGTGITTDYSNRFATSGSQSWSIDTGANSVTFASNLQGAGSSLNKIGSGTLILTGSNTYDGTTTVTAGKLQIGNGTIGSISSSSSVNVVTSAGLYLNLADGATFASSISGGGALVKQGTGTMILTGTDSYTGSTTINGGTLQIANSGVLGNGSYGGSITFASSATLQYSSDQAQTFSGAITGTGGNIVKDTSSSVLTLSRANSYTGATRVSAGTLKAGATNAIGTSSAVTISSTGTLDLAGYSLTIGSLAGTDATAVVKNSVSTATLTAGGNNTSTSFAGVLQNGSGTLALTKAGTGTLTLSGTNTYGGTTSLRAGTLQVGSASALSLNSTMSISAGATLDLNGYSATVPSLSGSGTVTNSANSFVDFTANGGSTGTANVNSTFAGVISGKINLVKQVIGNLTLTGANTYTGTTTINSGWVQIGNTTSTGTLGSGDVIDNSWLTFARTDNITVSNNISGSGNIQKNTGANASLTLTGNNSYSGLTIILHGTVVAGSATALGTNSAVSVGTSSTIDLAGYSIGIGALSSSDATALVTNSGAAATLTIGGSSTNGSFSGVVQDGANRLSLTKVGSNTQALSGNNTYTGTISINGGALTTLSDASLGNGGAIVFGGGTLQYGGTATADYSSRFLASGGQTWNIDTGGNTVTFASNLQGAGSSLNKIGSGTLILTGNNTYDGATTVTGGMLQIGDGSKGQISASSAVTIVSAAGLTLDLADGAIFSNSLSGGGDMSKLGTGTNTLTGANTYTGTTTILEGTLALSGSWSVGTNTATIVNQATLFGTGAITAGTLALSGNGNTSLTGSNRVDAIATSGTIGALTFNNAQALTLGALSSTGDVLVTTQSGNLTLTGAITTTGTSDTAIVLAAGENSGAGVASGGDIVVSGGSVTLGDGGQARLYTGSLAGSTSAAALGTLDGFRYGSTRAVSNFTRALAAGTNVVYREQPTLSFGIDTGGIASRTYDGTTTTPIASYTGMINGDSPVISGSLGTARDACNYSFSTTSLANDLGYAMANVTVQYTIDKHPLVVSALEQSKFFAGKDPLLTFTFRGLADGDTASVFSGGLARAPGEIVGSYYIGQGSLSAGNNYAISYIGAEFKIGGISAARGPDAALSSPVANVVAIPEQELVLNIGTAQQVSPIVLIPAPNSVPAADTATNAPTGGAAGDHSSASQMSSSGSGTTCAVSSDVGEQGAPAQACSDAH